MLGRGYRGPDPSPGVLASQWGTVPPGLGLRCLRGARGSFGCLGRAFIDNQRSSTDITISRKILPEAEINVSPNDSFPHVECMISDNKGQLLVRVSVYYADAPLDETIFLHESMTSGDENAT